jgi:putative transposase
VVYRFIDNNKEYFGLRWLCRRFGISPNGYYNYLKDTKVEYHEQRETIYERIKYIYYNNNRTVGHRAMRVFLSRYGIHLSKTTVHKYMNKTLNLAAIIMRKKPGYTSGKKQKVFNNSNFAHPKQACNNAQQGNVTP